MLRRIEADERGVERTGLVAAEPHRNEPPAPAQRTLAVEPETLARDRARWTDDAVSISHRARELVARLRPIAVRVLHFWDHRMHAIIIGGRRVYVDAAGGYRID